MWGPSVQWSAGNTTEAGDGPETSCAGSLTPIPCKLSRVSSLPWGPPPKPPSATLAPPQAEACLVLADRFSSNAAAEDTDVQFKVWAMKSVTKAVPLYVQVRSGGAR